MKTFEATQLKHGEYKCGSVGHFASTKTPEHSKWSEETQIRYVRSL